VEVLGFGRINTAEEAASPTQHVESFEKKKLGEVHSDAALECKKFDARADDNQLTLRSRRDACYSIKPAGSIAIPFAAGILLYWPGVSHRYSSLESVREVSLLRGMMCRPRIHWLTIQRYFIFASS